MEREPDAPIILERLHAVGTEVYTTDAAIRLARVPYGPNHGLTEDEARAYAALFAAARQMQDALETTRSLIFHDNCEGLDGCGGCKAYATIETALAACAPKSKGRPFRAIATTESAAL